MNFDEIIELVQNEMNNYNVDFDITFNFANSLIELKIYRWEFCSAVEIDYYTTDINLVPNICHNLVKKLESHIVKDLYK